VAKLAGSLSDDAALIDELYLTAYSRYPTDSERASVADYLKSLSNSRRRAVEDILWSLMNTPEFLFNH
jgi:hypothetical protein